MQVIAVVPFVAAGFGAVSEGQELELGDELGREWLVSGRVRLVGPAVVETTVAVRSQQAEQAVRHGRRHHRR